MFLLMFSLLLFITFFFISSLLLGLNSRGGGGRLVCSCRGAKKKDGPKFMHKNEKSNVSSAASVLASNFPGDEGIFLCNIIKNIQILLQSVSQSGSENNPAEKVYFLGRSNQKSKPQQH